MPVIVITGNYASGKTTLMEQKAADFRAVGIEPVCIDYDRIAVALGSTVSHGHADHFTRMTQRLRGLAIQLALAAARDYGATVLIVDASPTEARWQQYRDAQAEIVTLEVDAAELHRRADAERPELWHRLIDEWTPTAPTWNPDKPKWRPRPKHAKGMGSAAYQRLRKAFLADKTNCQHCGIPFVTDAPCTHPTCLRRGKGCVFHPQYPTVQHTRHLADGGPLLDTSTWEAWASGCNTSDGVRRENLRRSQQRREEQTQRVELDW